MDFSKPTSLRTTLLPGCDNFLYNNNNNIIMHKPYLQVVESPAPVLDLSVRKRSHTPEFSYNYPECKRPQLFSDQLSSTIGSCSPTSRSECSDISISSNPSSSPKSKITRPFKAYTKNPVSFPISLGAPEFLFGKDSAEAYAEFRQKMLSQMHTNDNEIHENMRRNSQNGKNEKEADPTYLEKRRKNNEAAKRSRDARKAKADEIAIRCTFLEQENLKLKLRIAALENERLQRLNSL